MPNSNTLLRHFLRIVGGGLLQHATVNNGAKRCWPEASLEGRLAKCSTGPGWLLLSFTHSQLPSLRKRSLSLVAVWNKRCGSVGAYSWYDWWDERGSVLPADPVHFARERNRILPRLHFCGGGQAQRDFAAGKVCIAVQKE